MAFKRNVEARPSYPNRCWAERPLFDPTPHMISQPISHAAKASRTPKSGDTTYPKLAPRHSRHNSSIHPKISAMSGSAVVAWRQERPPGAALRGRVVSRSSPCARRNEHASTIARVRSLACACSWDGFPSGWFERTSSRKRKRISSGVVVDGSSPRTEYACRMVTARTPASGMFR